ncbi:cadherin-1-like isoform X1 [Myripristis murdjan]|uniref:cadherin-1-like isoform X1 n=1 Tax=Myripristis murdjan TaxID=586833 RepID=UPI00117630B4|nr:cadherin-1-like isoform X1 [Myripristis murdjan]
MGSAGCTLLGLLTSVVFFQALTLVPCEAVACVPGFEVEKLIFRVCSRQLHSRWTLGNVGFQGCSARFALSSSDGRFTVDADGTLTVNAELTLHTGHHDFLIHAVSSQSDQVTVPARVKYDCSQQESSSQDAPAGSAQIPAKSDVPVLSFPKPSQHLRRRKRAWVIPPINYPENDRGPFPKFMVQIRSDEDKFKTIRYSISGSGVDQPPVGLFAVDRDNGNLYITQPLDRERQDSYLIVAHAEAVGSGAVEELMEIRVVVIDMNDNVPIFTKDTFLGDAPEASPVGFEVIKVEATDLDEPGNANSDIRYRILRQDPELPNGNMFAINPVSGMIRVNSAGLDRETCRNYTLDVQAADLEGHGHSGQARVIISISDSNDHAPAFSQSKYEATVPENKVGFHVAKMLVTDGDEPHSRAWIAKFTIVSGDPDEYFTVESGANQNEGIITTAKGLDFERARQHTLLVAVENDVPFATQLPTATATVLVNVQDVDEAPIPNPGVGGAA